MPLPKVRKKPVFSPEAKERQREGGRKGGIMAQRTFAAHYKRMDALGVLPKSVQKLATLKQRTGVTRDQPMLATKLCKRDMMDFKQLEQRVERKSRERGGFGYSRYQLVRAAVLMLMDARTADVLGYCALSAGEDR